MVEFILGFFAGGILGVFIMCLILASKIINKEE